MHPRRSPLSCALFKGWEVGISAASKGVTGAGDRFASAYKSLREDGSVQFDLTRPDPPPTPPSWLGDFFSWLDRVMKPVADFFRWIDSFFPDAPYARILLWFVLAILAAALLWLVYQRLRHGAWQWRRTPAPAAEPLLEEEWAPDHAPARRWLEEADELAAAGRYGEAIHHLLIR